PASSSGCRRPRTRWRNITAFRHARRTPSPLAAEGSGGGPSRVSFLLSRLARLGLQRGCGEGRKKWAGRQETFANVPRGQSTHLRSSVGNFLQAIARSAPSRSKSEACLDGASTVAASFADRGGGAARRVSAIQYDLLAGRPVGRVDLHSLLPDGSDVLLIVQTHELDVLKAVA